MEGAGPDTPKGGRKYDNRQEKEDAGDLEPKNATHAAEGAQETAYAAGDSPGDLPSGLTGGATLRGGIGNRLARGGACGGLCAGRRMLTRDAPGNPQADAQGAANGVRLHSVYDGSSGF
jgi:hypothetical protein